MNTSFIIQSEFVVSTMIEYMTIHQLLQFRQVTCKLYTLIDIDFIKGLVIGKAQNYLKKIVGDQYEYLVQLLQKCKGIISGVWLTMLIYGETKNMEIGIGYEDLDVAEDMDNSKITKVDLYDESNDWIGYSAFNRKIIFMDKNQTPAYAEIFQNTIQIIDNKWRFEIKNINKLVNKREVLDICSDNANNVHLIRKCQKNNIRVDIQKISEHTLKSMRSVLGFYDSEHIMILGSCVQNIGNSINIKVNSRSGICSSLNMSVNCKCARDDCILNILSYPHFHSILINNKLHISIVLVEYTLDDDIFVNIKRGINMECEYIDTAKYTLQTISPYWRNPEWESQIYNP